MKTQTLDGKVLSLNISPKGVAESFLLKTGKGACQVNLPKGHDASARFQQGAACRVTVQKAEDERPGDHPVYELAEDEAEEGTGVIQRLNYARHGAPNGVVLKDGVFLHMKPEGAKSVALKPGQKITYAGERRMGHGGQIVIEVTEVNGRAIAGKKPEKKKKR